MDLVGPLEFSSAAIAESVSEKDFPFATLAEEPLLLNVLCHSDSFGPHFSGNRRESDMLLYAAQSSKSCRPGPWLSQYHSKMPPEGSVWVVYCWVFRYPNASGHVNLN